MSQIIRLGVGESGYPLAGAMGEPYPHGIMQTLTQLAGRFRGLSLRVMVAALPVIWPAMVMAQSAPQPNARKVPPVWLGYLVIFGLLVVVMAVSMMPSKRSHQD